MRLIRHCTRWPTAGFAHFRLRVNSNVRHHGYNTPVRDKRPRSHLMVINRASTFGSTASRRIGLLVPSSNVVMEVEFYRSLPNDITVHTSHIPRSNQAITPDAMQQ